MNSQKRNNIIAEIKADVKSTNPTKAIDFQLCTNTTTEGYFVRYTKIGFNPSSGNPTAEYRWVCFNTDGVRVDCDPLFASIPDENKFYKAMHVVESFKTFNDLK